MDVSPAPDDLVGLIAAAVAMPTEAELVQALDELTPRISQHPGGLEFERALAYLEVAVRRRPSAQGAEALRRAGNALAYRAIIKQAARAAIPFARQMVELYEATPDLANERGWAYGTLGALLVEANEPAEAISWMLRQSESGDLGQRVIGLGNCMAALMQLGLYNLGAAIGREVSKMDLESMEELENRPPRSLVFLNLAECELHLKNFDAALRAARRALDYFPAAPVTAIGRSRRLHRYLMLATCYAHLGRHEEASDAFESGKAFREGRRCDEMLAEHGSTLLATSGRLKEGIALIEKSLTEFRDGGRVAEWKIRLAGFYELDGRFEDARRVLAQLAAEMRGSQAVGTIAKLRQAAPSIAHIQASPFDDLREQVERKALATSQFQVATGLLQRLTDVHLLQVDPTGARAYRVAKLAALLFREQGASNVDCQWMAVGAGLIDVGYTELPRNVLSKAGRLAQAERELVQGHPKAGALIVGADSPELERVSRLISQHHERWDGSGYPNGLKGEDICIEARVVGLADVYDALTHARPWRKAFGPHEVIQMLEDGSGTLFDPTLTRIFVRMISRLGREHPDLDEYLAQDATDSPAVGMRARILSSLRIDAQLQ